MPTQAMPVTLHPLSIPYLTSWTFSSRSQSNGRTTKVQLRRGFAETRPINEPLQCVRKLRQPGGVVQSEIAADLIRAVKYHRKPHILHVLEQVLDHGIHDGHVRHHLAEALAALVAVVSEQTVKRRVDRVRQNARVDVAERNEPVGVLLRH